MISYSVKSAIIIIKKEVVFNWNTQIITKQISRWINIYELCNEKEESIYKGFRYTGWFQISKGQHIKWNKV